MNEWSAFDQFLRTPWLFIKNIPEAFAESVKGVPGDVATGVKGVLKTTGEGIGEGLKSLTDPIKPVLFLLGAILILGLIIWGFISWR